MGRDFQREMFEAIAAATSHGSYTAAQAAHEVVEKLRVNDPELLSGWLEQVAVEAVRSTIVRRDASDRARARLFSSRVVFGQAAAAADQGDTTALARWLETVWVADDRSTRKKLGEMTGHELAYAAANYTVRAQRLAMTGAFLRALATQVGDRTVSEVYTDEQLAMMWQSISPD